jgi:hypothetical protein
MCVTKKRNYTERVSEHAADVANALDADILLFNGYLYSDWRPDEQVVDLCASVSRRPNVMLILVTRGGDANVAYRIARCLQENYDKFYVYITGRCKSAGTLIALGADEIVISDHGELGPLDVQISKPDELFGLGSGLDVIQAIDFLKSKTYSMLEDTLLDLKVNSGNRISTKTATEIATNVTTGLFKAVYEQIDPTRLGEIARAMRIAQEYGRRLDNVSQNLQGRALQRLANGYPSHGFVIDRNEAQTLFKRVREPADDEILLAYSLELSEGLARHPHEPSTTGDSLPEPVIRFLSANLEEEGEEEHEGQGNGRDTEGEREEARRAPQDAADTTTYEATPNGQRQESRSES